MKIISKEQAVHMIRNGSTVGIGGFGAYGAPESLLAEIRKQFDETGNPQSLTVTTGVSPGSFTMEQKGLNRMAADGLIDTIIAGHFANPPMIANMVGENKIAGYAVPLGVLMHLYDAIAGHKPGVLTPVGLGTFADPRIEGCRANQKAADRNMDLVNLVNIGAEKYLLYKSFPVDISLIRGTYADAGGNISVEEEAEGDFEFELAAAAHNSGGIVIAEVKAIVNAGSIPPKKVRVHGSMIDYVVVGDEDLYMQGYNGYYKPELSGDIKVPSDDISPMPMSNRKIIARRAALELAPDCVINLGIGMPSGIGSVANEEGIKPVLSLETGPLGGVPVEGPGFGASTNPDVIYNLSDVFHLYDGGILDMTFLGAAEIDKKGNVNVSKFAGRCSGPGGFINITQATKKVAFIGTFTAGGLKESVADGKLVIEQEGSSHKFVEQVEQITFSGDYAVKTGQRILYITERAVFRLTKDGLLLEEIAPGADLQKDILDRMDFRPLVSDQLKIMDGRIFRPEKMGNLGKK